MARTVEAIIDQDGNVRLLESVHLPAQHRAVVTILEESPTTSKTTLSNKSPSKFSPAQRAAAWREAAKGLPDTPPLSDEAISRENIYNKRG